MPSPTAHQQIRAPSHDAKRMTVDQLRSCVASTQQQTDTRAALETSFTHLAALEEEMREFLPAGDTPVGSTPATVATHLLQFFWISPTADFVYPLGYFFEAGLPVEQLSRLVMDGIVALSLQGLVPLFTVMVVIPDSPHVEKLCRNSCQASWNDKARNKKGEHHGRNEDAGG